MSITTPRYSVYVTSPRYLKNLYILSLSGYRKGHSTETALQNVIIQMPERANEGQLSAASFFDLQNVLILLVIIYFVVYISYILWPAILNTNGLGFTCQTDCKS